MAKANQSRSTGVEKQGHNKTKAAALFGRLREVRARAQNLRDLAAILHKQTKSFADPRARDQEMHASLQENFVPIRLNCERITVLMEEMRALLNEDAYLYSGYGDTVSQIQVAWDQAAGDWLMIVNGRTADCPRQLSRVIEALDSAIYECCIITLPGRIKEHLDLLPIGGALNFREAYADELSTPKERRRFLSYLNLYPMSVEGLIDVQGEQIFRAAPSGWRRSFTVFITAALALAGFGLIFLACYLGDWAGLSGWPFTLNRLKEHLLGYTFLLVGALVHVVITLLKQDREASGSSQALSDWLLRIHVKENSFIMSALSLWIGSAAMAFLFKEGIDWKTAFFVGYSYDSLIDLFLQRFETVTLSATEKIQKDLRGASLEIREMRALGTS